MRILLVKLTSMGDLIHALPALTDALSINPNLKVDWVVDEAFHEVPLWHPAVDKIIKSAHRRWKKDLAKAWRQGELHRFYRELRAERYDMVVDAQNNLKSAFVTRLASAHAHGLDKKSVRESFSHLAYKYRYPIARDQHAVDRLRHYFSQLFRYPLAEDALPDYGIQRNKLARPELPIPGNYLVFVHLASWPTKLWPFDHWQQLINLAISAGYEILLPSGSNEELERSKALANGNAKVHALPRLPLSQVAWLMAHAKGVVSCDTGLCHLAAALDIPAVSFYGPTDVNLIGATGRMQMHIVAQEYSCAPCYKRQCNYNQTLSDEASCMRSMRPDIAWNELSNLLQKKNQATSEMLIRSGD